MTEPVAAPAITIAHNVAPATLARLHVPVLTSNVNRPKVDSPYKAHFDALNSLTTFVRDEAGNVIAADATNTPVAVPLFSMPAVPHDASDEHRDAHEKAMSRARARVSAHAKDHGLSVLTRSIANPDGSTTVWGWKKAPAEVAPPKSE